MIKGYVVAGIDTMSGRATMQAIVTQAMDGLTAAERAEDIAERLRMMPSEGRDLDFRVYEVDADATNFELGIIENLGAMDPSDFVRAAMLHLKRFGVVRLPGWMSEDWLIKELDSRFGLSVLVDNEGLVRAYLNFPRQGSSSEDDGFQETRGTD